MECGKVIFKTQVDAIQFIKNMHKRQDKRKSGKQISTSYYCADCDGYHVTSGDTRKSIIVPSGKTQETHIKPVKKEKWQKTLIIHSPRKFKIK